MAPSHADPAYDEARLLLEDLGLDTELPPIPYDEEPARWARSGAMALTGLSEGPPAAPRAPVASRLVGAAAVLSHLSALAGTEVRVDGPALLGERAALRRLHRQGQVSAGGATRLLRAADGWLAVSLARPEDLELVPAWLELEGAGWDTVAEVALTRDAAPFADRGQELGLAVAVVPCDPGPPDEQLTARHGERQRPWVVTRGSAPSRPNVRLGVVDLSALWAGPLCAQLLGLAGAEVTTVESVDRPDGARRGDAALHALLHRGHRSVQLDFRSSSGRAELHRLITQADVLITSARPRALEQLGIWDLAQRPGLTWVAVTGYGLTGPWRNRVAYGDDAAAAGGLVVDGPLFCADAAADPCTGLYAAIAALACVLSGGGVVDIALREVARHLARAPYGTGPDVTAAAEGWVVATDRGPVPVAPPRARP